MSASTESGSPSSRNNPLIWIALVVVGLILFVFFSGDRGQSRIAVEPRDSEESVVAAGTIERSLLVPPGMRARQYIEQLRNQGPPFPLDEVHEKAVEYQGQGSLADAHLLYFFAAREDHLPSIMTMGEMSDPIRFRAENSLLDNADVIQAHKWYQKAAALGDQMAAERISGLREWAKDAATAGNSQARQLLINTQ